MAWEPAAVPSIHRPYDDYVLSKPCTTLDDSDRTAGRRGVQTC
jgi:hypothetical protein